MLTRCTHCSAEYVLEDASLPTTGMSLECGHCHNIFGVVSTQEQLSPATKWQVRLLSGALYEPSDLATLQRWISERRLTRDDLLTQDGTTWQRLGNISEFAPLFATVPEPKAMVPPAQPVVVRRHSTPAAAAPPRARAVPQAMPRLASLPDEGSGQALPGSLQVQCRTTGRRRTDSRTTLDRIFAEKPGPSAFSFPMDLPEDDDPMAHQRHGRTSRGLFVVLLLLGVTAGGVYAYQPNAVAGLVSLVRRAPVNDTALQQVNAGYEALDRDSIASIQAAMGAFDRASRVDNRFAEARAGQAEAELRLAESYQQAAEDLAHYAETLPKRERLRRLAQVADQKQEANVRREHALNAAKEALTLAPESAAANRALADYYREQGADPHKLKPLLDRARAAAPQEPRLSYVIAAAQEVTPAQAIQLYRETLAAAPQLNHARYRLARLLVAQNDKAGALEQVEAILRRAPDHELAQALLQQLQPSARAQSVALPELPPPSLVAPAAPSSAAPPSPSAVALAAPSPAAPPSPSAASAAPSPAVPPSASLMAPATPSFAAAPSPAKVANVAHVPATAQPSPAQPMALVQSAAPPAPLLSASSASAAPAPAPLPATADVSANVSYDGVVTQGQLLRSRHQPAEAAVLFQRGITKEPNNPRAYVGLAWCDLDQKDVDGAVAHFTQALKKAPRHAEAHFGLAEAYRAKNERREAMRHYREYLSITPDGLMAPAARQMLEELSK